jgi:two-component system, OmpR family, response regulator
MTEGREQILIVDDEPDMCWALEKLFNSRGFVTQKALSAQEALELMAQHHFGRAFLDAKLPDMDGLDLARCLLSMAPEIHIIMVSGYFYRDDLTIQVAISQGLIRGFISKPFLQDEILKLLEI